MGIRILQGFGTIALLFVSFQVAAEVTPLPPADESADASGKGTDNRNSADTDKRRTSIFDLTLYGEAEYADGFGAKVGFSLDYLRSVSERAFVGFEIGWALAILPICSVDGEATIGTCRSPNDGYSSDSKELILARKLTFVFAFHFSKAVLLRWNLGFEFQLPTSDLELYNLIPCPTSGLGLDFRLVQKEKYSLSLTPKVEITILPNGPVTPATTFGCGITFWL